MFALKACQLLSTAARGAFYPFISVFLLSCGIPPATVGLIMSIKSFCITFFSPAITAYADNTQQHARVTFVCTAMSSLMVAAAYAVMVLAVPDGSVRYSVAVALPLTVAFAFRAPIVSLMDGAIMMRLQKEGRPEDYGKIRLYGTIGYGLAGSVAGFVMGRFGDSSVSVLFVTLQVLSLPFINNLFAGNNNNNNNNSSNDAKKKEKRSYRKMYESFKKLYKEEHGFGVFVLTVILMGCCKSVISTYYPVVLALNNEPKSIIGLSVGLSVVGEIPLFYFSNVLIRRYGPKKVILFAQAGMALRLAGYTLLHGKLLLLPQLLHGVTYALLWASIVNYTNVVAPPAYSATVLSLISVCFNGISAFVSELASGFLLQYMGCMALFKISTAVAVVSAVGWAAFLFCDKPRSSKKDQ